MPETKSDLVDLDVRVLEVREASIRVETENTPRGGVFLPLSQIEVEDTGPGKAIITLPQWLAEDRSLV